MNNYKYDFHCIEKNTKQNLSGTLTISNEEIRAKIYNFREDFKIDTKKPIYFFTEKAEIVSFYENIDAEKSRTRDQDHKVFNHSVIANVAVVGRNRWTEHDKIKRVSFTIKHSLELLSHLKKYKALENPKSPGNNIILFENAAKSLIIRARYEVTYGMYFDAPQTLTPVFEIEFDEPKNIKEYIEYVSNYVNFFSFCLGVKLKPERIRIDRLSNQEFMAALKAKNYPGDHEVHYVWPEQQIDTRDLWAGGVASNRGK